MADELCVQLCLWRCMHPCLNFLHKPGRIYCTGLIPHTGLQLEHCTCFQYKCAQISRLQALQMLESFDSAGCCLCCHKNQIGLLLSCICQGMYCALIISSVYRSAISVFGQLVSALVFGSTTEVIRSSVACACIACIMTARECSQYFHTQFDCVGFNIALSQLSRGFWSRLEPWQTMAFSYRQEKCIPQSNLYEVSIEIIDTYELALLHKTAVQLVYCMQHSFQGQTCLWGTHKLCLAYASKQLKH